MATDIKQFQEEAQRMVRNDKARDLANAEYDRMYKSQWHLPDELEALDWIHKVVSTDPHDAISAGVRVLSTLEPLVKILPTSPSDGSKKKATEWERALKFILKQTDRRRPGKIVAEVVKSALMYDEVVINVVDLDYQIKQMEMFDADTRRFKAARRHGRFLVNIYHPSCVHVRYSNLGTEAVLLVQKSTARNVLAEWGKLANKHVKLREMSKEEDDKVILYDYSDWDNRCVWVVPEHGDIISDAIVILQPEKRTMDFFPWVTSIGGATLDEDPQHQRQPVLYSILNSGQWETQNVVRTLYTSEVISHAAAPRLAEEGPMPESTTEVDYGDPNKPLKATPGNIIKQMHPPEIDSALAEIDDRISGAIDQSTVSRILKGGDVPSGTAFATLNLATQTAVGALKPAKGLSEKILAEMFFLIMLWAKHTNTPLTAYGEGKKDLGEQYIIDPGEIDPEALCIEVELKPDVPTDRQQKVNTASVAVESIDYPIRRALEDVGVEDPEEAIVERMGERLLQAFLEQYIQRMQMEMQMALAQLQAMSTPGYGGAPVSGMPPPDTRRGVPPQAFNPAERGQPPAVAEPSGLLRENILGLDREGNPITGII